MREGPDIISLPQLAGNKVETASIGAKLSLNLYFEQRWFFQELLIGDLMSSLALAPLEKINLFLQRTQRKHFDQNTLDSTEELESFDSTLIDKDVVNITRSTSKSESWGIDGQASLSLGSVFNLGLSGNYAESTQSTSQRAVQMMNESTQKSSRSLRATHKIEVKESTEEFEDRKLNRTIINPYYDRTVTIKIFNLLKKYCVECALVRVEPCLIVNIDKLTFDRNFIYANQDFLSNMLLDSELRVDLSTSLESVSDLRLKDNQEEIFKVAEICTKYFFDEDNIFVSSQKPLTKVCREHNRRRGCYRRQNLV